MRYDAAIFFVAMLFAMALCWAGFFSCWSIYNLHDKHRNNIRIARVQIGRFRLIREQNLKPHGVTTFGRDYYYYNDNFIYVDRLMIKFGH